MQVDQAAEAAAPQTNSAPADTAPATDTASTALTTDGQQAQTTATTEATPAAATTEAAPGAKAEPETPAAKAPEQYADFTLPEGYQLDSAMADKFKSLARELDLTQEQAQKLVSLDAERVASQAQQVQQTSAAWLDQTKGDKEIGGDKLLENVAIAQKALNAFGTPELKALLEQTGMGNHPEIIRAFFRAGKSISEDTFVAGGTASNGTRDHASALYPNTKQ